MGRRRGMGAPKLAATGRLDAVGGRASRRGSRTELADGKGLCACAGDAAAANQEASRAACVGCYGIKPSRRSGGRVLSRELREGDVVMTADMSVYRYFACEDIVAYELG